jgi:hypothetical protein
VKKLECVVLTHYRPLHFLRVGDLGAEVEIYPNGGNLVCRYPICVL